MHLKTLEIGCYFDSVTDICIGVLMPDKEQLWLAGASKAGCAVGGKYLWPLVVHVTSSGGVFYEFHDSPMGRTAQELYPFAVPKAA